MKKVLHCKWSLLAKSLVFHIITAWRWKKGNLQNLGRYKRKNTNLLTYCQYLQTFNECKINTKLK